MRRLSADDRNALGIWGLTRVAVAVMAFAGVWLLEGVYAEDVGSFFGAWDRWDTGLFIKVAQWGYLGYPTHYPDHGIVAFFPGEPFMVRIVHLVVRNWVASGLVISAVAGAFAAVYLARIARLDADPTASGVGSRAVLYLVLSPYAVFLAAAYSEALFLALALPAWYAARRHRWVVAGVLAGLAATVRITGLFLALALVVQWLAAPGRERRWRDLAPLALPFAAIAAYFTYLHHITGDWLAWQHAQADRWHRHFTAPWTSFHTTWDLARTGDTAAAFVWDWRAQILAALVGVVLTAYLARRRRWAEAVYIGGQVAALSTSEFFISIARTALLWWPLWILLAQASLRRRWVHWAYLAVAPALMAVVVLAFTHDPRQWVG